MTDDQFRKHDELQRNIFFALRLILLLLAALVGMIAIKTTM